MSELCLTLLCPPQIAEALLDLLLTWPQNLLFTSTPMAAHGLTVDVLDQSEQVMGRARAIAITVLLSDADKRTLLGTLHQQFAGSGLRYWLTAVTETGEIA
ncbi:MAG TPA: DUF3240 family protein [Pseudomonadales bacterium]|jgi:hypothetical protein|nr:DUF3240 family protein [Pseudomonadales bacterium]HMW16103.1 DUF3240 family protein [Pseudomonadales bacterium]HMW84277.1 DUF3240 family protein [Pseudomonadales bacterium]HMY97859.1 DUF3240 family protein [Pseudomonadales bacterium]HMZ71934.1 DUF3240 family protein [Pseudomonadales bacterium]